MPYQPTYPAAAQAAPLIEAHFASHFAAAQNNGDDNLAPVPLRQAIEHIIDVGFWTSIRREEGHSPKISMVYLPPENSVNALHFEKPVPLVPHSVLKMAPGTSHAGVHLGVWHYNNTLAIWGTTQNIPNLCFVLNVLEPGLLAVKHRRMYGFSKYTNIAVFKGNRVKIINDDLSTLSGTPSLVKSLLDFRLLSAWNDHNNVLIQLCLYMRAHNRGGAIIVNPANSVQWKRCVTRPMTYGLSPTFNGLYNLVHAQSEARSELYYVSALRREAEHIANLTAIDGATVIDDEFRLHAFGVKLIRAADGAPVEEVFYCEPVNGNQPAMVALANIGGTRHISAAQYIYDNHPSLALVASQDGHCTLFYWSETVETVAAIRIDSLLL